MGHGTENPATQIWDADDYNKSNGAQHRDARETINQILKDGITKADIIVDIGCGSGNVTKMLSSSIPHNKIYASDFDPQMVDFADKNHNDGTIEFFPQDIGVSWEHLDERLRKLEGKVDLVWSNRVLHWVPEGQRSNAAGNIARLLKPNGRCYINITLIRDLAEFAEGEEKKEVLEYTTSTPPKDQMATWKKIFDNSGLSHVNDELIEKDWVFETEKQFHQMMGTNSEQFHKIRMNSNFFKLPQDTQVSLGDKYWKISCKAFMTKFGQDPAKYGGNFLHVFYEQLRVIGSK